MHTKRGLKGTIDMVRNLSWMPCICLGKHSIISSTNNPYLLGGHQDRHTMRNRRRSGNAIIEVTFLMPWLLFLFVGVFDMGFYAYTLIAVQNAARAVALHNSMSKAAASDSDGSGCSLAIFEMSTAAYGENMNDCSSGPPTTIITVASTYETAGTPDGNHAAKVVINYRMAPMIPIPVPGKINQMLLAPCQGDTGKYANYGCITRVAWMRVNPAADF